MHVNILPQTEVHFAQIMQRLIYRDLPLQSPSFILGLPVNQKPKAKVFYSHQLFLYFSPGVINLFFYILGEGGVLLKT